MMRKFLKVLVDSRMIILSVLGVSLYMAVSQYHISLWYILATGVITGVIFGKIFCRWVCPMGLMMEMMINSATLWPWNRSNTAWANPHWKNRATVIPAQNVCSALLRARMEV